MSGIAAISHVPLSWMTCGPAGVSAKIVRERPFVWAYVAVFKEPIVSKSMHAVVINLTGWLVFELN